MGDAPPLRARLRALPVFAGPLPEFDPAVAPADPETLFARWLEQAVAVGVPEPHAMTLATVDDEGLPDARVLILKDLDERGWWFASSVESAKGRQLERHAAAALCFYWPLVARQVRVRGAVVRADAEESAADFRGRGVGARAVALAGRQSAPLDDLDRCREAVEHAAARIAAEPATAAPTWSLFAVAASTVEFWQADWERRHVRLRYQREGSAWRRGLLWP